MREKMKKTVLTTIIALSMLSVLVLSMGANVSEGDDTRTGNWADEEYRSASWSGTGTDTDPYLISSGGDLGLLAYNVDSGNKYTGAYFKISDAVADIDMSEHYFTPIGKSNELWERDYAFDGSFDGNGKTLTGLRVDETTIFAGLFGFVGVNGVIKNIGLVDSDVTGSYVVGGIAGFCEGNISGCYNTGTITGANNVGGIVGINDIETKNCYNTGDVTGTENVGGVIGLGKGASSCYNTGTVTGTDYNVGGIIGKIDGIFKVYNSYNAGNIVGGINAGGIAGVNEEGGEIYHCYNTKDISGINNVGGILGTGKNISNCYNMGAIITTGNHVGPVIGYGSENLQFNYFLKIDEEGLYTGGLTIENMTGADALTGTGKMTTLGDTTVWTPSGDESVDDDTFARFTPRLNVFEDGSEKMISDSLASVTHEADKSDYEITVPESINMIVGDELSDADLSSYRPDNVPGSFEWVDDRVLSVGTTEETLRYVPNDIHYKIKTFTVTVVTDWVEYEITPPETITVTVGTEMLSDQDLSAYLPTINGEYVWVNDRVLNAGGTFQEELKFIPDEVQYEPKTFMVKVIVEFIEYEMVGPNAEYTFTAEGQRLSSMEITDGKPENVPGKYVWVNGDRKLNKAANSTEDIMFVPDDTNIYAIKTFTVTVIVEKDSNGAGLAVSLIVLAVILVTYMAILRNVKE